MELADLLNTLHIDPQLEELLQPHWDDSARSEPRNWAMLQREYWQEQRAWCGCHASTDGALEEVTALISAQPALRLLAWHCHRLVFEIADYNRCGEWTALIPPLERLQRGCSGAFFLWIALGAAPLLRERNERQGIPAAITRATLEDIAIVVRRFARYNDGAIGIQPRLLTWHRLVASGDLHRVGRLEYIMRPFRGRLRAYRHCGTGRVVALSEPDIGYDADGYWPQGEAAPAWSTPPAEAAPDAKHFTGCPISPRGFARNETIALDTNEWEQVLAPGDLVLEIHIPEGEALTPQSCRESFIAAREFFAKHYPQHSISAFTCYSWLLNTQLETMLRPGSNLAAWQHELYLFPVPSTGRDGLYFVFCRDEIDPATAPRDTTLRRALADHLASGQRLRSGGMFFLFDDLPRYGTQYYRAGEEALEDSDTP